jgi:hypothetical protein
MKSKKERKKDVERKKEKKCNPQNKIKSKEK